MSITNSVIDLSLAKNRQQMMKAAQKIADKIPLVEILKSSGMQEFLLSEKSTLATIVNTTIENNEFLKSQAERFALTPELIDNIIPAIAEVAGNSLANRGKINEIFHEATSLLFSEEPDMTKFPAIVDKAVNFVGTEPLSTSLTTLGEQLLNNQEQLQTVISKAATEVPAITQQLNKFGISEQNVQATIPVLMKFTGGMLQHTEDLSKIYKNAREFSANFEGMNIPLTELQQRSIKSLLVGTNNLLIYPNFSSALKENLPTYLLENKKQLGAIVNNAIENVPALKSMVTQMGIKPDLVQKNVENIADITASVLPSIHKLTTEVLKDSDSVVELLSNAQKALAETNTESINRLVDNALKIQKKPGINNILTEELPRILTEKTELISKTAKDLTELPNVQKQLKKFNITPEMVESTVPMLTSVASAALQHSTQLTEMYKKGMQFADSFDMETELTEDQKGSIKELVSNASAFLTNPKLSSVINKNLPRYLTTNKRQLGEIVCSAINNSENLKVKLSELGINEELVKETVEVGADVIASALPEIHKFTTEALKDPESIANLAANAQQLISEPNKQSADAFLDTFIKMQEKNPAIKKVLAENLPKLINQHSEALAPVINEYLNNTTIGKKFGLDAKKILDIASDKLPGIIKFAENYNNKNYSGMLKEAAKIIFDRKVMRFAVGTAAQIIKNKFKGNKENNQPMEKTARKEQSQTPNLTIKAKDKTDLRKMRESLKKHVSEGQASVVVNKSRTSDARTRR